MLCIDKWVRLYHKEGPRSDPGAFSLRRVISGG